MRAQGSAGGILSGGSLAPPVVTYTLRPATEADLNWLRRLHHAALRPSVERQFGWDERVQDEYFERTLELAKQQVMQAEGVDAGVLSVERRPAEIYLREIYIVPEQQGRGLGTTIIRDLQRQAEAERLPMTLQVLFRNDRARALYERLGFVVTGRTETHHLMRWDPPTPQPSVPERRDRSLGL